MHESGCRFVKQQKYHSTWTVRSLKMLEQNIRVFCNRRTVFYCRRFCKDYVLLLRYVSASLSPRYHLLLRSQWNSQMDNTRLPVRDLWQTHMGRPGFPKFCRTQENKSISGCKMWSTWGLYDLVAGEVAQVIEISNKTQLETRKRNNTCLWKSFL